MKKVITEAALEVAVQNPKFCARLTEILSKASDGEQVLANLLRGLPQEVVSYSHGELVEYLKKKYYADITSLNNVKVENHHVICDVTVNDEYYFATVEEANHYSADGWYVGCDGKWQADEEHPFRGVHESEKQFGVNDDNIETVGIVCKYD